MTSLSPEAVAQLVESHREFLAFLERRVESRAAAEDILQSAFARGLEYDGDVDEEKVVAWFYRILRNAVIDHYRRRDTSSRAVEAFTHEFPDIQQPDVGLHNEICHCLNGVMITLKPEYREALQVVDIDDGALNDLAQRSGITADNAAVRIHRARKALRRQLEKCCGACAEHGCLDCTCK